MYYLLTINNNDNDILSVILFIIWMKNYLYGRSFLVNEYSAMKKKTSRLQSSHQHALNDGERIHFDE